MSVKACDKATGKSQSITITASSNLTEADIDAAVKDAEKYAEEDKKRRAVVDAKNNAEQLVFAVDKFVSENGDKLEEADKNAVSEASKAASEELAKAESEEDVKAVVDKLTKVTDPIFTKFYQQNPEAAQEAAKAAGINPEDYQGGQNPDGGVDGTVD